MKVMKFYSPCCGQCRVVAREFKDNPINVPIENINVVEEPEIADKYNVSKTAIATAWILRHPAKIQTIVGTTNKNRLRDICTASNVNLTRQEWYEIYLSAGNMLP